MLFADVAGFTGLPEEHLPEFFQKFLGIVEQELKTTTYLLANTWGDALYIVFADVVACADFALRLLRKLKEIDFQAWGIKLSNDKQPGVRIGLHTGPTFEGMDPIIGKINYFGSHVSRAARIEPVTTPGCLRERAVCRRAGDEPGTPLCVRVPGAATAEQGLRRPVPVVLADPQTGLRRHAGVRSGCIVMGCALEKLFIKEFITGEVWRLWREHKDRAWAQAVADAPVSKAELLSIRDSGKL